MYSFGQNLNVGQPINRSHPLGNRLAQDGSCYRVLPHSPRGTTLWDLCGRTSGTLASGAAYKVYPQRPGGHGCVEFDANNAIVTVTGGASRLTGLARASVAAWAYSRGSGESTVGRLFTTDNSDNFAVLCNAGNIDFAVNAVSRVTGVARVDNAWQHYCAVLDGTNAILYRNGLQVGSAAYAVVISTATDLIIGNRANLQRCWDGFIDDFQVYTSALSAADVYHLYHATRMVRNPLLNWTRRVTPIAAAGSSFQAAWARGSNVLISPGAI